MDPEVAGSTPANRTIFPGWFVSQMPGSIHLFVQDANDPDACFLDAIENCVALELKPEIAFANALCRPARVWPLYEKIEFLIQSSDILFGLVERPFFKTVKPDSFQISLGPL